MRKTWESVAWHSCLLWWALRLSITKLVLLPVFYVQHSIIYYFTMLILRLLTSKNHKTYSHSKKIKMHRYLLLTTVSQGSRSCRVPALLTYWNWNLEIIHLLIMTFTSISASSNVLQLIITIIWSFLFLDLCWTLSISTCKPKFNYCQRSLVSLRWPLKRTFSRYKKTWWKALKVKSNPVGKKSKCGLRCVRAFIARCIRGLCH